MGWRIALLLLLVLACGCNKLFSLDHVSAADAAGDATLVCPADYDIVLAGSPASRYKRGATPSAWINAATACSSDTLASTHLTVISSDVERLQAARAVPLTNLWTGLDDRLVEGTYVWVTDEQASVPAPGGAPWSPGQPDNTGDQDCVRIEGTIDADYDDEGCDGALDYLCECDGYADQPMTY